MDDNDLTTIGHFPTLFEASMARNRLEAADIPAVVADDYTLTTDPMLAGAVNFIKLQVRSSDADRAAEVLAERPPPIDPDEIGHPEVEESLADEDGAEEEIADSEGDRLVQYGYRAAMFGCISLPVILHGYSLYLLLKAAMVHQQFTPQASRKFYIAFVIDLAWIALALILVRLWFAN